MQGLISLQRLTENSPLIEVKKLKKCQIIKFNEPYHELTKLLKQLPEHNLRQAPQHSEFVR